MAERRLRRALVWAALALLAAPVAWAQAPGAGGGLPLVMAAGPGGTSYSVPI